MSENPGTISPLNPLPLEHRELADAAKALRYRFNTSQFSHAARTFIDAIGEHLQARAQGMTREDAARGLEAVVRDVWPAKTMPTHWQQPCVFCDGTGRRDVTCDHGLRCGRRRCSVAAPEFEHAYVVPCDCEAGDPFRLRARQPESELVSVGQQKPKSKGWRRIGR